MKRLLTEIRVFILSCLGFIVLKAIYLTSRVQVLKLPCSENYLSVRKKPVILLFWHSQQLLIPATNKFLFGSHIMRRTYTIISEHSDGRIIAKIIRGFGLYSVAGSSSKGARKAALRLIKLLQNGNNIAITPDGPRGPVNKVKEGVVRIAQISGYPIVPIAAYPSKCWRMKSWDRMIVPKPFSTIKIVFGEPITINEDQLPIDDKLNMLAEILNNLSNFTEGLPDA